MDKEPIIFANGIKVKQRFDGLLGVSINVKYFKEFLEQNEHKGYVNIDICRSKEKNSWYARLNTWKPDKKEDLIGEEEIPF